MEDDKKTASASFANTSAKKSVKESPAKKSAEKNASGKTAGKTSTGNVKKAMAKKTTAKKAVGNTSARKKSASVKKKTVPPISTAAHKPAASTPRDTTGLNYQMIQYHAYLLAEADNFLQNPDVYWYQAIIRLSKRA